MKRPPLHIPKAVLVSCIAIKSYRSITLDRPESQTSAIDDHVLNLMGYLGLIPSIALAVVGSNLANKIHISSWPVHLASIIPMRTPVIFLWTGHRQRAL